MTNKLVLIEVFRILPLRNKNAHAVQVHLYPLPILTIKYVSKNLKIQRSHKVYPLTTVKLN